MEQFTEFYQLTKPIEVVNPTSSVEKIYGPYPTMERALNELSLLGLKGRQFTLIAENGEVDLYLYQENLEPKLVTKSYRVFDSDTDGLVPKSTTATESMYLNGVGQWSTPPNTTYSSGSLSTLNDSPTNTTNRLWSASVLNQWLDSKNFITEYTDTTYSTFTKDVGGLVPAPTGTTSTRYLREDGTWVVPTNTTYSSGTDTLLKEGKDTSNRVWSSKILYDFISTKLDKPTSNNTNEYVLLGDGSTESKNNFGKVDTVMGVVPNPTTKNVDISAVAMNWTNPSQRFSGIQDKSIDATYNLFALFDANGNLAKASAIGNALESGLQGLPREQSLRIGQLLNGGKGSSGAISVNLISPPIIQNKFDSVEYVLLRGANLLLNSTDMSISICDAAKNVIKNIPNNQIINNSESELIFYYNFYQFAIGTYYIKITSGVKVYYTTLDLNIVQDVENKNIESINWDILYDSSIIPNSTDIAQGSNIVITTPSSVGSIPKITIKSDEIFSQGEDFYLELAINNGSKYHNSSDSNRSYIGIGYSSVINNLVNNTLISYNYNWEFNEGVGIYNNNTKVQGIATPIDNIVTIIKTGNLFRMIIGTTNYSLTLSNNNGYSIFMAFVGRRSTQVITTKVMKAFKFN